MDSEKSLIVVSITVLMLLSGFVGSLFAQAPVKTIYIHRVTKQAQQESSQPAQTDQQAAQSAAIPEQQPAAQSAQLQQQPLQTEQMQQQPPQGEANQQQPAQTVQAPGAQEIKKELTGPAPVLEIKRLESEKPQYSIELRDVLLTDLFRVIAHDYNLNILMDSSVTGKITASFTNISLEEALDAIAEMSNLTIETKGNIIKVSPNLTTKTFVLKYVEAKKVIESSAGGAQPAIAAQAGAQAGAGATGIYGLLSDKGKILLGQQQNSLTVIDYPENVNKVEEYLNNVDHRLTTRIFKLKYLKADEVVGATAKTTTTTQTISPTGTQVQTTTSSTTGTGGSK